VDERTSVMAHRGASRAARENTVAAFRRAREMGAHAVELDVRRCASGELVVSHDPCPVPRSALAPDVPLFDEALDACAQMWVNVEIKNDPSEPDFDEAETVAREVAALLVTRPEPAERWLVSSFRRETTDAMRRCAPGIAVAWLCLAIPDAELEETLAALVRDGYRALHPWVGALTRETVAACHRHGLAVNTWTCDDPARMRELAEWGVDGICTNVPDLALATLAGV
jgi:glycerophosphoryl diester phosphodiesterase